MNTVQKDKNITIAVLPFQVNCSNERTIELFQGFTDDLITNFSKFLGLSVISSYSTRRIKDINDHAEIEKLGADYLIFGTVRSLKEKLRISLELVYSKDHSLVFAGHHDETMTSLLEAQDSIVQQIVSVLQEKINYNLLSHSYKKNAVELAAYENYLLGMNVLKKGTAESDIKAREYFNAALEINPNFSLAYTGLSLSYFNFWSCLLWNRWEISQKGAHEAALKAIEIDPDDYLALAVLGRTYIYLEDFDRAEHYLRKSLRMNSNDTSHLLRVAFSLMYLGYPNESIKLYQNALHLNPFHPDSYYAHGSNYYLESGDFETSIALSKKASFDVWTDYPAFVASAYLQIKDYDNMWKCWDVFLSQYKAAIYDGEEPLEEKALSWLITVNPYKGPNYLYELVDFVKSEKRIPAEATQFSEKNTSVFSFQLTGDVWNLSFVNKATSMKDSKGLHDIYKLLGEPQKEFHCLDLMNAAVDETSTTLAIDGKAKSEYMQRIQQLQKDIQEAQELNLYEKADKLQQEYDSILTHLSQSLGLAGKSRKVGSTVEKARSAVTWRIRSTIKKIKKQHPELANHLSKSIKTGTFCSYSPEHLIHWKL